LVYYKIKYLNKNFQIKGGSGWLASHEAIRLFGERYEKEPKFCVSITGFVEDQEMSNCYRKVGVYPGESRDSLKRERFLMNAFEE
jgi:hypothetical protein